MASPAPGRDYLERLSPEHLSGELSVRARDWLREHLEEPLKGLPRDQQDLVTLITQIVLEAERQPAPKHAMELNLLLLEQQRLERGIAAASRSGDDSARSDLMRRRADLVESLRNVEMGDS